MEKKSVLIVAPRYYPGSRSSSTRASAPAHLGPDVLCLRVSSRVPSFRGAVDYRLLWRAVRGQFRSTSKAAVDDRDSFMRVFEASVAKERGRVVVLIEGAGRGNEENHYDVLATFHWLMVSRPSLDGGKLTTAALDDYSLFYWTKRPFLNSPLYSFLPEVHIPPLQVREIEAYLQLLNQNRAARPRWAQIASVGAAGPCRERRSPRASLRSSSMGCRPGTGPLSDSALDRLGHGPPGVAPPSWRT